MNNKFNLLVAISLLFNVSGFSMSNDNFLPVFSTITTDSANAVEKLLEQRRLQINTSQSTRLIDQQLFSLGYLPQAIISKSSIDQTSFTLKFYIYKTISSNNVERIGDRLKTSFTGLKQITINPDDNHMEAEFEIATSQETLLSFLLILGYQGYEIK